MKTLFKTDDLSLGAFLLARGAKLIEVTSDRPRHSIFVFDDLDHCEELKRDYINNGQVVAREFVSRREELMSEVRNGDGNYGYKR